MYLPAVWRCTGKMLSGERLLKRLRHYPDIPACGRAVPRTKYPRTLQKGTGIFRSRSRLFLEGLFSCGSCTISSARRSGLTGAPKVKRRLNCTTNQSSEERIVIVTLFRTLAFNGLLSVFCGGLPDSIGNGWFGIKVLGAAARNLSVCSDRKDGAAESMLQTTSSYGTTCGSVVNQPFFPGRIRKSRD